MPPTAFKRASFYRIDDNEVPADFLLSSILAELFVIFQQREEFCGGRHGPLMGHRCKSWAVATNTIRFRFDDNSTSVLLPFDCNLTALRPFDDYVTTGLLHSGCPLFFNIDFPWLFHDFSMTKKMKIHDLSTQHIFPSKQYTTYECILELVSTVPSARSTIVKRYKKLSWCWQQARRA